MAAVTGLGQAETSRQGLCGDQGWSRSSTQVAGAKILAHLLMLSQAHWQGVGLKLGPLGLEPAARMGCLHHMG